MAAVAILALTLPVAGLAQNISTLAGTGIAGTSADNTAASATQLRFPSAIAVDATGNIYYADTANHRVRKIASGSLLVTTVAGNGTMAFAGDGGAGASASLSFPASVAVDTAGNVYIADTGNARIRKVAANGTISTVAGSGTVGYSGDGGPATSANLYYPCGVAVDATGILYISDTYNHRVRAVALDGRISTIAGTGAAGFGGDAGSPTAAQLQFPEGLAFSSGTLYVADTYNQRVRKVVIGGVISSIAGIGTAGSTGDGGAALSASLNLPTSLALDSGGNLFVSTYGDSRIRVMPATGAMISAFAGTGAAGYSGDSGDAGLAALNAPGGVATDAAGSVYIADSANQRIRKVEAANTTALNVIKAGSGSGTVVSAPAGISCGATCFKRLTTGTTVTLTATPVSGSTFTGWTGDCTGTGTCTVTLSAAKSVTATFGGAAASGRLTNVSTRGQVQTGDNRMIGGFIVGGSAPKNVLVTARGPSLTAFGVAGALANPTLQLFSGQTVIATNDDWQAASNAAAIQASGKAPTNSLESAILMTLNPGAYTAVVAGVNSGIGVGIVEVFELDRPDVPLTNLSTRGQVQTGDNVMIGGFVIDGTAPRTVLIRARGPSLTAAGVTGALANPSLQIFSGQTVIASNDDWGSATNAAAITATGLAPTNALESAALLTLNPGAYTAIVSGVGGGTGVGIVEVFAQ